MKKTLDAAPADDPGRATVETVLPGVHEQFSTVHHGLNLVREDLKQYVNVLKEEIATAAPAGVTGKLVCGPFPFLNITNIALHFSPPPKRATDEECVWRIHRSSGKDVVSPVQECC